MEIDPATAERQRIATLDPPLWCKAAAFVESIMIRTLRIALGILIAILAGWLIYIGVEVLSRPFASLSPLDFLGGLLASIGGFILFVPAFSVSFGAKGPSRIETEWRESQANPRRLLGYEE